MHQRQSRAHSIEPALKPVLCTIGIGLPDCHEKSKTLRGSGCGNGIAHVFVFRPRATSHPPTLDAPNPTLTGYSFVVSILLVVGANCVFFASA